jgi:hypothetical protein
MTERLVLEAATWLVIASHWQAITSPMSEKVWSDDGADIGKAAKSNLLATGASLLVERFRNLLSDKKQ